VTWGENQSGIKLFLLKKLLFKVIFFQSRDNWQNGVNQVGVTGDASAGGKTRKNPGGEELGSSTGYFPNDIWVYITRYDLF
jgi:hypothetical protein